MNTFLVSPSIVGSPWIPFLPPVLLSDCIVSKRTVAGNRLESGGSRADCHVGGGVPDRPERPEEALSSGPSGSWRIRTAKSACDAQLLVGAAVLKKITDWLVRQGSRL